MIIDPNSPGLKAGAFVRGRVSKPERWLNILYVDPGQSSAQILVSELFRMGDGTLEIHTACPVCAKKHGRKVKGLRIVSSVTAIHVEGKEVRTDVFRCPEQAQFGGRCTFSGAIEPPPPGMDWHPGPDGSPVRIDAVLKQSL